MQFVELGREQIHSSLKFLSFDDVISVYSKRLLGYWFATKKMVVAKSEFDNGNDVIGSPEEPPWGIVVAG